MVDWAAFTPVQALLGGVFIGLSACVLWLGVGRIAGMIGIFSALFEQASRQNGWRFAFLLGLLLAPMLWSLVAVLPASTLDASWFLLGLAGLLVGFGARFGSGCTSGHGVCGLARGSARSLVATAVFMSSAVLTVLVLNA